MLRVELPQTTQIEKISVVEELTWDALNQLKEKAKDPLNNSIEAEN